MKKTYKKSKGEYPDNWDQIATYIKNEAGWKCVRCEHKHDTAAGYMLTVHHLDGNKANCEWWNLPALCQRCHLRIQGKVKMSQEWMFGHSDWFKPYLAGYYAHLMDWPEDSLFVLSRLDDIIEKGRKFE